MMSVSLFFCFFKQKTAYELRISDLSSDVCSSDLVTPVVMGRRLTALERRLGVQLMHRSTRGLTLTDLGEQFLESCQQLLQDFDAAEDNISIEIGRASWRERVCQNV